MTECTDELLAERGKTHGEYSEHARCTQAIMTALMVERNWTNLPDIIKETCHMVAHKLGRIVTGNPYVADHYDDIAGYARLISQRVEDGVGLRAEHRQPEQKIDTYMHLAETLGITRPEAKRRLLAMGCEASGLFGTPEDGGHHARQQQGEPLFNVGDTVRCVYEYPRLTKHWVYTIKTINHENWLFGDEKWNYCTLTLEQIAGRYPLGVFMLAK